MTTIRLSQSDFDAIVSHARTGLPNEACGLLAGMVRDGVKTVEKIYPLSNPDCSPEHFSISPQEQLAAVKDMRAHGLQALGNFHSHPASPARPSAEDIRLAYDPHASYLILSLAGDTPVLKAFSIVDGAVQLQTLAVL